MQSKPRSVASLATTILLLLSFSSGATLIEVESEYLGGSAYTYNFSLENDNLADGIEEISIFFDFLLYSDLRDVSAPVNWDALVIQPEPILNGDGFVDLLSLVGPLGLGEILIFEISFDFLGMGEPGDLYFEVIDPTSFSVIDQGVTVAATPLIVVAEPGSLALLGIGLAGLGLGGRTRRFWRSKR